MKILVSDTHFGCRQNSIIWLDSQMRFFYEQLIPFIKKQREPVSLYHLGDVFDVRSTVNLLVANRVHKLFEDLKDVCNRIIILGGNHDYYSPIESEANVNSLHLVLGDLEDEWNKLVVVDKDFWEDTEQRELFVPWFRYFDFDELKDELSDDAFDRVYIHNDLTVTLEDRYRNLFKNYEIYSGHIHTPSHKGNLHTLGSTFALTFSDCNSDRGFYTMNDDGTNLQFHPNEVSIKFYRFYNKDLFNTKIELRKEDYVELYVNQDNLLKESYVEKIKDISKKVNNIVTIPKAQRVVNDDSCDFEKYDIVDICRQNIPDNLIEKFNKITLEE